MVANVLIDANRYYYLEPWYRVVTAREANVLIDANRYYYPIERVPEFWEWLADLGEWGLTKVPPEIYDEVVNPPPARQDVVVEWLKEHRKCAAA